MNVGKFRLHWLGALVLLIVSSFANADSISATVDRHELNLDETLRLLVRVSPQANQTPDFSLLENQFDILSRNQSSQYRNFNGQVEAYTEWQLILAPKSAGKLLVPSFQYGDQFSDAISINVKDANSGLDGLKPDTFLELTADLKTPYVQQQVLVTLTLYTAVALRIEDAPELSVPGALVSALNQSQFQKRVDDKVYSVSELRYAVFPQQSGKLEIPIQTFTVTSGGNSWNGYGRGQIKRIRSQPLTLEVKPQATQFSGNHWLPAIDIQLEDNLADQLTWQVGEPVTRRIKIHAEGITPDQLPSLALPDVPNIKQYRETPEKSEQKTLNGISSVITETLALVPTASGQLELPAVTLHWWDTRTQQARTATLPAKTITVEGSLPQLAPTQTIPATMPTLPAVTEPATQTHAGFWPWLAGLLLLSNMVCLWLWQRDRREPTARLEAPAPVQDAGWQALLVQARAVNNVTTLAQCLDQLNQLTRQAGFTDAASLTAQHNASATLQQLQGFQALVWRDDGNAARIDTEALTHLIESIQVMVTQHAAPANAFEPVPDCYPR